MLHSSSHHLLTISDLRNIINRLESWKNNGKWFKKRVDYSLTEAEDSDRFAHAYRYVINSIITDPTVVLCSNSITLAYRT